MKFGRKLFFTRGLYNSPGTFVGHSRDLAKHFYDILCIFFEFLVLIFLQYFVENIEIMLGVRSQNILQ